MNQKHDKQNDLILIFGFILLFLAFCIWMRGPHG